MLGSETRTVTQTLTVNCSAVKLVESMIPQGLCWTKSIMCICVEFVSYTRCSKKKIQHFNGVISNKELTVIPEAERGVSEQSGGGARHSAVCTELACTYKEVQPTLPSMEKRCEKNTVKHSMQSNWNSLQGSLPNACASLCDTLPSFNMNIQQSNNIYRSEKMEKHNSPPLICLLNHSTVFLT